MPAAVTTHGILNPEAGEAHFELTRHEPSAALQPFVERYWIVRWDLRGRAPYAQQTLPHPCVNLAFERAGSGVHGVGTKKFVAQLEGVGHVVGAKFKPGGFYPFVRFDISRLTDRVVPVQELFDVDGPELERQVLSAKGADQAVAIVEDFLRRRLPDPDENVATVADVATLALRTRSITRVEELAAEAGLPVRTLQRLFRRYVGVSAKWVIRRYRVHEAAALVASGEALSWAALAHDLGYADQSHFIRDFESQVGQTPARYAAVCRNAGTYKKREPPA